MAETHIGELPPGTKRCKVCAEPINISAKKCIHCQSDQEWTSRLGFSATVLSLLVALITVLTAAIPVIRDAITPRDLGLLPHSRERIEMASTSLCPTMAFALGP